MISRKSTFGLLLIGLLTASPLALVNFGTITSQPGSAASLTPTQPDYALIMTQTATALPPVELLDVAPLAPNVLATSRQTYETGMARGNHRDSFILIGDSNTVLPGFLRSFGDGRYELDQYSYLQDVIDLYAANGAFKADYPSAQHGMTMNMLMDPQFVNPRLCPGAAHLLACAAQLYDPSVAIIYMGTYDTCHTPFEQYRANFDDAMRFLMERGVIPVLTGYSVALDKGCWINTPAYMQTITDMATRYQVPFIDLHAAIQALPQWGMQDDGWHLSWREDYFTSFAGDQYQYGNTLRELLTLQMLHVLQRDVMR